MTPSLLRSFMDRWQLSHKRVAAAMGPTVSVPALRRYLAEKEPIADDLLGRAERWLRSLKGNPEYDKHFREMARAEDERDIKRDTMRIAADSQGQAHRGKAVRVDTNQDGNPTYVVPARSAEKKRDETLAGVR